MPANGNELSMGSVSKNTQCVSSYWTLDLKKNKNAMRLYCRRYYTGECVTAAIHTTGMCMGNLYVSYINSE